MAFGDYTTYRRWNPSKVADVSYATSDTSVNLVTAKDANHQLFVQRIVYVSKTSSANVITVADSNSSALFVGSIPISQAAGTVVVVCDYGPQGKPLTAGKNLVASSSAGPAGEFHVEGYEKIVNAAINSNAGAAGQ